MIIHYSRNGYNGDFTYTSVCGKRVKTHQENEKSSIYPEDTNCKKCLITNEFKIDTGEIKDVLKRIYIESDILNADEFCDAQKEVLNFIKSKRLKYVDRVFSKVLDMAWHNLDKTWQEVKNADEIYSTSSLFPLIDNSYTGAPVIFNEMCKKAVDENIINKSVIILNQLKNIHWDHIDIPIMKKAFKKNSLFMYDDEYENLININISKIKK